MIKTILLFLIISKYQVEGCDDIYKKGCTEIKSSDAMETELFNNFEDHIKLECININLTDLNMNFCNPRYLKISGNEIEILDEVKYANLTNLFLSNNKIRYIRSNSFLILTKLIILDLSNNLIGNLNHKTFNGLINLEHLILKNNNLYHIDAMTFKQLKAIQFIDLSYCNIILLDPLAFDRINSLIEINLSYNILSSLQSFGGMANLSILNISGNRLRELDAKIFENMPRLRSLDLQSNHLSHIIDLRYVNGSLAELNLKSNYIKEIDSAELYSLHKLIFLDLSYNHLTLIDKEDMPDELLKLNDGTQIILWENPLNCESCNNLWMTSNLAVFESNNGRQLICSEKDENDNHLTLRFGMQHCINKSTKASTAAMIIFIFIAIVAMVMLFVFFVRKRNTKKKKVPTATLR